MWAKVKGQRDSSVGIRENERAAKNEAKEQSDVPKRRRHSDMHPHPPPEESSRLFEHEMRPKSGLGKETAPFLS